MRERYGANKRSQQLKYHIQTSGRSLHAQEIQFNDIRTTLQALFDNCNSLHTNAYDEAISSMSISSAACWSTAFCGSSVPDAGTNTWSLSLVNGGGFVPVVARGGWSSRLPTWSITYFRKRPSDNLS